jgi:5-methylthioadenosine/S-adenosylhomocysteine deaminase
MATPIDLLISSATVLRMDSGRTLSPDTSIAIDAGEILELGGAREVRGRYAARREIDASGHLAMPGFVNGHNHLFQVLCRGLGEGHDLSDWASAAIWPIAAHLDREACEVAAQLACIEMIESGTTCVVDSHYLHGSSNGLDGIASACLASGIRAVLCRAAMDVGVPTEFRESVAEAVGATERFAAVWEGRANRILVRPEAMSEAAASADMIRALRQVARDMGAGFHMHASEVAWRPEQLEREVGCRTIEYLDRLGVLGREVVLAHCVWLSDQEMDVLARTGTSVVHNPVSNGVLGDGIAPIPSLRTRGVAVGLGSDGAASNDAMDMFEIMKSTLLLQRATTYRVRSLPAYDVLAMATCEGARALGLDTRIGSLEPGKRADVVLLSLDAPRMVPRHSLPTNVVLSASSRLVDTVIIEGRIVAEGGQCTSLDRGAVVREAEAVGRRLRQRAEIPAS